jgi:hypothetical protein
MLSCSPGQAAESVPATETRENEIFGKLHHCKPGPWGDIEYYHVYLEPPSHLWEKVELPDAVTKWKFPGGTDDSARALFQKAGLPAPFQDFLLNPGVRVIEDNVLTVFPPLPDLLAMTSEQRVIIYSELGTNGMNPFCLDPVRIVDGDIDSWLAHSELRPELRESVKKLAYQRGDVMCFSDIPAVIGMAESEKESRAVAKALWRTRSLVMQINLKSRSDFAEMVRYWSGPLQNQEFASIIQPTSIAEGEQQLDIVHLLPPVPRRYLYRYPSQELMVSSQEPDCNWTCMNFFSATPSNLYDGMAMIRQRLNEAYVKVEPPYRFGDMLLLLGPNGNFTHSCIYLADDIVYTKNGKGRLRPWLLMKLDDLIKYYSFDRTITVRGYRLKPPQHEGAVGRN